MSYFYNFNRKEITSGEISSGMDFGKVLSNYKIVTKPFYKTGWFAATTAVTLATIATLVILNTGNTEKEKKVATTPEAENKITYSEDSPCIKPPQKNADIPFAIYTLNNNDGGNFKHSSGTEVNIPSDAFTLNGKPVDGEVEIRYREFHDMADCILSGIPMTYDSAGTQYHFESAGMLEIRAYKNNEPLDLEKKISISMASDYSETKYNLYELDEKNNNWVCIGKDKVEINKTSEPGDKTNEFGSDKLLVTKETRLTEVKEEIAAIKKTEPDKPAKRNPAFYSFTLDVLADEFPELTAFSTTRFEVDAADKNFSHKLFKEEWEDIKLKDDPKTGNLKMILTKGVIDRAFTVYPVYEGTDYTQRKEKFEKEFKSYTEKLDTRVKEEKQLETEIAELRKQTHKNSKTISENWTQARNQNASTLMPSGSNNDIYASNYDPRGQNIRAIGGYLRVEPFKTTRNFEIGSLGVINVDCGVSRPIADRGKKHRFQFRDKEGVSLAMSIIYVLVKKRNVMFTYFPEDFEKIRMQEDGENIIVGITQEGFMGVAVQEDLKLLNWDEKTLNVDMRVFKTVKDPIEFKKIIYPNS